MVDYVVSVKILEPTRTWLRGHTYSMFVFKGIQAGAGAVSTVWQKITDSQLYAQETNRITWTENFYIGETQTQTPMESGVKIQGVNPYNVGGSPAAVGLGKQYTFGATAWEPNPKDYFQTDRFAILNSPRN